MAVTQNPIIGRARQKFGNAIFQKWKESNVIRTKPLQVANPDSPAQRAVRSKMVQAVYLYRLIAAIITIGYKKMATTMSEYNAFIKDTLDNAFDYTDPLAPIIDYSKILVAKGTISSTAVALDDRTGTTVDLVWNYDALNLGAGQTPNDMFCCAYLQVDDATNEVIAAQTYVNVSARSTELAQIEIPAVPAVGKTSYLYTFFTAPDGRNASDSLSQVLPV